jgi:PAS domain S-box-containing protein
MSDFGSANEKCTVSDCPYRKVVEDLEERCERMRHTIRTIHDRVSPMGHDLQHNIDSYQSLAETSTDAILQINQEMQITFVNSAAERMFNYKRQELIGETFSTIFPSAVYQRYHTLFAKYFVIDEQHRDMSGMQNTIEVLGITRDSNVFPMEISFGNSKTVQRNPRVTCILRDITQRKIIERKLRYLAYHDRLTDLGNRDLFFESIEETIKRVKRDGGRKSAVMFLDLDGFKSVNDTLGHAMGDRVLQECSRRLEGCLRESDHIFRFDDRMNMPDNINEDLFRFGGDEFVVLLPYIKKPSDAATVARKIIKAIRQPFIVSEEADSRNIKIGVSIGIAVTPEDGMTARKLITSADVAMYKAKEVGNHYVFFNKTMNRRMMAKLQFEQSLSDAMLEEALRLHFQPIIDERGRAVGAEALLRWFPEDSEEISPEIFIPFAEETGLIVDIGDWVLERACRSLGDWERNGLKDFFVSVNISPKQFRSHDFVERICSTINRVGINPGKLKLEVTEGSIMDDPVDAIRKMELIKEMNPGLRFAIDDFGTGYSSLSHLSNFPADILKIDKSFVMSIDRRNNAKIVKTIIDLADSLGLGVVAEGVETNEQAQFLLRRGCRFLQGFLFSEPVPHDAVPEFAKNTSGLLCSVP